MGTKETRRALSDRINKAMCRVYLLIQSQFDADDPGSYCSVTVENLIALHRDLGGKDSDLGAYARQHIRDSDDLDFGNA